jgi:hypothetical protein
VPTLTTQAAPQETGKRTRRVLRPAACAEHHALHRHYFSHTWLDNGGAEGDLMEINGWASPQMLRRYGASACSGRARRHYDHIMDDTT